MDDPAKFVLTKAHLYEQVADLLERDIMTLQFESGRLPSEQALAEQFHVSRTIIREALKLLMERGLIDSRTGSGARVTKPCAENLSVVMSRIILMDDIDYNAIYDVRSILEEAAVQRAVENATEEDLTHMEEELQKLKNRQMSVEERRDIDFRFHYLIAQASGNPLLLVLVKTMSNVFKEMIKTGIFIAGGIDDAILRHERIMNAIRNRDGEEAVRAMHDHLEQSRKNVETYQRIPHPTR